MGHSDTITATVCTSPTSPETVRDFGRFRKKLFIDRLGWDLATANGVETDQFDDGHALYCVLHDAAGVCGGFRAIRTDWPYLAEQVFPSLASMRPYPKRADVWEISRFGVSPDQPRLGKLNYALMFRFALARRATALVAIADLTYERFLAVLGVRARRYGPPQIAAHDAAGRPMELVAGEIPLADQSGRRFDELLALARTINLEDTTDVPGYHRISA